MGRAGVDMLIVEQLDDLTAVRIVGLASIRSTGSRQRHSSSPLPTTVSVRW
jgi:hypothetical protein